MNGFWRYCLSRFENELPAQQFRTWIRPLKFSVEGDVLTLIAPNRFVLQWIRDRFLERIQELATGHFDRPVEIKLLLADTTYLSLDLTGCTGLISLPELPSSLQCLIPRRLHGPDDPPGVAVQPGSPGHQWLHRTDDPPGVAVQPTVRIPRRLYGSDEPSRAAMAALRRGGRVCRRCPMA